MKRLSASFRPQIAGLSRLQAEDEGGWHWEGGSAERDPPWSLFTATGTCVFGEEGAWIGDEYWGGVDGEGPTCSAALVFWLTLKPVAAVPIRWDQ